MVSEKEKTAPVAVVMGSDSDMEVMQNCIEQLGYFGIEPVVRIISAHRTPQVAAEFAQNAVENGIKVIIAAAGMAAHLAAGSKDDAASHRCAVSFKFRIRGDRCASEHTTNAARRAGGNCGYREGRGEKRCYIGCANFGIS